MGPLVGGKLVQEGVAVAAAVEKLHPEVNLGGQGRGGGGRSLYRNRASRLVDQ
jgi:hypothetical protein